MRQLWQVIAAVVVVAAWSEMATWQLRPLQNMLLVVVDFYRSLMR